MTTDATKQQMMWWEQTYMEGHLNKFIISSFFLFSNCNNSKINRFSTAQYDEAML